MAASLVRPNIGSNVELSSVFQHSKHQGIKPFRQSSTGTLCMCVCVHVFVHSAEHLSAFTSPAYMRRKSGHYHYHVSCTCANIFHEMNRLAKKKGK